MRAQRRDGNERRLVTLAERMGASWLSTGPLDGWCWSKGKWHLTEIKACAAGLKHEYTPSQLKFFIWCKARGIPWWVWRADADVLKALGQ